MCKRCIVLEKKAELIRCVKSDKKVDRELGIGGVKEWRKRGNEKHKDDESGDERGN